MLRFWRRLWDVPACACFQAVFDKVSPVQAFERLEAEHSQMKQRMLVLEDNHRVSLDQHQVTQGKYTSLGQALLTLTAEHNAGSKGSGSAAAVGGKRGRKVDGATEDADTPMLLLMRTFGAMMCEDGAPGLAIKSSSDNSVSPHNQSYV